MTHQEQTRIISEHTCAYGIISDQVWNNTWPYINSYMFISDHIISDLIHIWYRYEHIWSYMIVFSREMNKIQTIRIMRRLKFKVFRAWRSAFCGCLSRAPNFFECAKLYRRQMILKAFLKVRLHFAMPKIYSILIFNNNFTIFKILRPWARERSGNAVQRWSEHHWISRVAAKAI